MHSLLLRLPGALAALSLVSPLPGQGSLTPPGAPAASMKSLAQVEPRIPVQSLPADGTAQYVISQPGSYYLTDNITGVASKVGIRITASNVTLDLSGFALNGQATSSHAIGVALGTTPADQIRILNGTISGWGGRGIYSVGTAPTQGLQISSLVIANCTLGGILIDTGGTITVDKVSVRGGRDGISLTTTGIIPVLSTVTDCLVTDISNSGVVRGIFASNVRGCTVSNIASTNNSVVGIKAAEALDCHISKISGPGVTGVEGGVVSRCQILNLNADLNCTGINARVVSQCALENINSTGSFSYGIAAYTVSHCSVKDVNGATIGCGISGFSSGVIDTSSVLNIDGATEATGIEGVAIKNCAAVYIGVFSVGMPTGLRAPVITGSKVRGLGSGATIASATGCGLDGQTISDCQVEELGQSGFPVPLIGIRGEKVSHCRTLNLSGANSVTGISAAEVTGSSVQTLNGGSASTSFVGISGNRVEGCDVSGLTGRASSGVAGVLAGHVTGTRVSGITESGSATGAGIRLQPGGGGATGCHVQGVSHVGIECSNSAQAVRDCTVQGDAAFGGTLGTIGIAVSCPSGHIRIDGNHVSRFATGISASTSAGIVVVRNSVGSCNTAISATANVKLGPSVSAVGAIATNSPWANFVF